MAEVKRYKRNNATLDIEASDLDETMRIAADCLRRTGGRPLIYEDTPKGKSEFMDRAIAYFDNIRRVNSNPDMGKPLVADIEAFCNWMGFTRATLGNYAKRSEEWKQAIDLIKQGITSGKKQLFLTGKLPPVVGIFDLCNNDSANYQTVSAIHVFAEPVEERNKPRLSIDELDALDAETVTLDALPELGEITYE